MLPCSTKCNFLDKDQEIQEKAEIEWSDAEQTNLLIVAYLQFHIQYFMFIALFFP